MKKIVLLLWVSVISSLALIAQESGNVWYYEYGSSTFNATLGTVVVGTVTENVTNPDATGINTNTVVGKFEKAAGAHSAIQFVLPGKITSVVGSEFKVKIYLETAVDPATITNNNIRMMLRKDGVGGTQLAMNKTIEVANEWVEYTVDFSSVEMKEDYYNEVWLFFASPDSDSDATGLVYYFDALQGPVGESIATAVSEFELNEKELSIFPNPVQDQFSVNVDAAQTVILDICGHVVASYPQSQTTFNVSDLASGVYIVNVTLQNGETVSSRILKQ